MAEQKSPQPLLAGESKNDKGQLIVPAAPTVKGGKLSDESADKYLSDAGWTVCGCTSLGEPIYDDPLGNADQKGQVVRACELPATQEGTRPVQVDQLVVPPTPWSYNMRHAVAIQRARDNHAIKQQQRKAG